MKMTPSMRWRRKVAAESAIKQQTAIEQTPQSVHLQLSMLTIDVQRLREIGAIAERTDVKRDELLPRYLPQVEQYLKDGRIFQNPVFSYCVIWLFDVGDYSKALDYAELAIEQNQATPENFKSNFPTFVADTILEWAEVEAEKGNSIEPYFSRVFKNVSEKWQLHEELSAKYYKFLGMLLLRSAAPKLTDIEDVNLLQKIDALLEKAHVLHRKIGVKTQRERIQSRINKLLEQ